MCMGEHVYNLSEEGLQVLREGLKKIKAVVDEAEQEAEESKKANESKKVTTPVNDKVSPSNQTRLGECDGLQDAGIDQSSTNKDIIEANENFRDCAMRN